MVETQVHPTEMAGGGVQAWVGRDMRPEMSTGHLSRGTPGPRQLPRWVLEFGEKGCP